MNDTQKLKEITEYIKSMPDQWDMTDHQWDMWDDISNKLKEINKSSNVNPITETLRKLCEKHRIKFGAVYNDKRKSGRRYKIMVYNLTKRQCDKMLENMKKTFPEHKCDYKKGSRIWEGHYFTLHIKK